MQVLRSLLDEVTRRVLSEAQRISTGDPAAAEPVDAPAAEAPTGDAREPEPGAAATLPAAEKGGGGKGGGSRDAPLTSIDISKVGGLPVLLHKRALIAGCCLAIMKRGLTDNRRC